jgi:hypothetical protein
MHKSNKNVWESVNDKYRQMCKWSRGKAGSLWRDFSEETQLRYTKQVSPTILPYSDPPTNVDWMLRRPWRVDDYFINMDPMLVLA